MTIQLETNHRDKSRVEVFLRALNEKLEQVPFDWKSLKESDRIFDAIKLTNIDKSLIITILFVEVYNDGTLIAKANFTKDSIRWGQNGSIMYVVESPDKNKAGEVASTFAGKE